MKTATSKNLSSTRGTHKTAIVELAALTFRQDISQWRVDAAKNCWLTYQHDIRCFNEYTGIRKVYPYTRFHFAEVTENGQIVNGNHRLTALMELGYTHAEVVLV